MKRDEVAVWMGEQVELTDEFGKLFQARHREVGSLSACVLGRDREKEKEGERKRERRRECVQGTSGCEESSS